MTADSLLARRRSPLTQLAGRLAATGSDATVTLTELAFRTMVEVRADPDGAAVTRIEAALGVSLPQRVGAVTGRDEWQVLWLGPGWWLVTGPSEPGDGPEVPLAATVRTAVGGDAAVVDVSAHRTTLALTGPRARDVLEHGCSIDLHPRAFGPGRCAHTMVAKAQVLLHQTSPVGYHILVRASYAEYLARWLLDAMSEYAAGYGDYEQSSFSGRAFASPPRSR